MDDVHGRKICLVMMMVLIGGATAVVLPRIFSFRSKPSPTMVLSKEDMPLYALVDAERTPGKSRSQREAVDKYLDRLGISDTEGERSLELLERLIKAHLAAVPFENLDLYGREKANIAFSIDATYKKIVERRRGGLCFEVNLCFGWLLRQLGFEARYALARVWRGTEAQQDEALQASDIRAAQSKIWDADLAPTHFVIVVHLNKSLYICDVGFGDSPKAALLIPEAGVFGEATADTRADYLYRIKRHPSRLCTLYRQATGEEAGLNGIRSPAYTFEPRILFDLKTERPLSHFEPLIQRVLTDHNLIFHKTLLAVRQTSKAKLVLFGSRLRITPVSPPTLQNAQEHSSNDPPQKRTGSSVAIPEGHDEIFLSSPEAFYDVLSTHFKMLNLKSDPAERALIRPAIDAALAPSSS